MRRALRRSAVAMVSVVGLAGPIGSGATHTAAAVVDAANRTATAAATPILAGPWGRAQEGYGHAEPRNVFNGGDPTGLLENIQWLTWGGPRAVGVGHGFYLATNQVTAEARGATAVIVAFKLGSCHGRRAYNAVQWYFPEYGEHFNPRAAGYRLCTG